MKIIEFCGTPGCGKSTLCDMLEERLRSEGKKVINLQKREKCNTLYKKLKKILRILCYKTYPQNAELKKSLYELANKQTDNRTTKKWVDRILEANWLIQRAEAAGYDFILFDEGCIQFLSSIMQNEFVADTFNNILTLKKVVYGKSTSIFHCSIGLEENIRRLHIRNKIGDRFTEGSYEDQMVRLQKKNESISYILKKLGVHFYQVELRDTEQALNIAWEIIYG